MERARALRDELYDAMRESRRVDARAFEDAIRGLNDDELRADLKTFKRYSEAADDADDRDALLAQSVQRSSHELDDMERVARGISQNLASQAAALRSASATSARSRLAADESAAALDAVGARERKTAMMACAGVVVLCALAALVASAR